jgi:hypothetical protein
MRNRNTTDVDVWLAVRTDAKVVVGDVDLLKGLAGKVFGKVEAVDFLFVGIAVLGARDGDPPPIQQHCVCSLDLLQQLLQALPFIPANATRQTHTQIATTVRTMGPSW